MYTELNQKLKEAQQGIARKRKLQSILKRLDWERYLSKEREETLFKQLQKENIDVDKLENLSLKKVIYSIFSMLVERTEKEKKEALEAKMKYDLARKELNDIDEKIKAYKVELDKYTDIKQQYDNLFNQKRELLKQESPETAHWIIETVKKINELTYTVKETKEAIEAGEQALFSIDRCRVLLQQAKDWAWWEPRRSLVIRAVKEFYLEDTQNAIWKTSSLIRSFNEELTDIGVQSHIQVEDVFFEPETLYEEFFWRSSEREKMDIAKSSLNTTRLTIAGVIKSLKKLNTKAKEQLKKRQDEINCLVVKI